MTKDVRLEVSEEQHEWLTELKSVAFLPAPRDGVSCLVNHDPVFGSGDNFVFTPPEPTPQTACCVGGVIEFRLTVHLLDGQML